VKRKKQGAVPRYVKWGYATNYESDEGYFLSMYLIRNHELCA